MLCSHCNTWSQTFTHTHTHTMTATIPQCTLQNMMWKELQNEKVKTALDKHSRMKRVKNSISSKLTTISSV